MKRIISVLLLLSFFVSGTYAQSNQRNGEKPKNEKARLKAEKKANEKAALIKTITDKNIVIGISRIYPMDSPARNTSDGYTLRLINDSLSCYLPYFGSSKTPIYGGQNLAIEAREQKVDPQGGYDEKSDSYVYRIPFKNENTRDAWICSIQIFTNGAANIRMEGVSRDPISYSGKLKVSLNTK